MKNYMFIFKKHKIKLLVLSLFIILSSVLYIGITYIGGIYIDIISQATTINTIYLVCFYLIMMSIMNLITKYVTSHIMNPVVEKIIFDFQYYVLKHLKSISTIEYKKFNIAYLAKRIEEDSRQISQFFVSNYTAAFVKAVEVIVIIIIVYRINFVIGIIMIALCPVYFLTYKKFKKPIFEKNLIVKEKSAEFFQDYTYHLEYLEDIIIEAEFERENQLLKRKFEVYIKKLKEFISINNKFTLAQGFIVSVMQITIFLIGGVSVFQGHTTVGRLSILISYFMQILSNITYYNDLARTYQTTKTSVHRIDALLDIPRVSEGTEELDYIKSIDANITFSIDDTKILSNVNVHAVIGDVIGVIGKNGTGKTTLLKLLTGTLKLNNEQSSIIFNNQVAIQNMDSLHFRKKFLAYTPQKIRFRDSTMNEVFNDMGDYISSDQLISFYHKEEIPLTEEIEEFIIKNWNNKMDNLSGGDKQIVAILRNILRVSSILFFDEPTSNLDISRIEWFVQLIKAISSKKITFVITHDNKISSLFNKTINLE